MKALVYHGTGKPSFEDVPKPTITAPTDAIVKITKTTICGTDLHILKGDMPSVESGRILGHEGVGIVEEIGYNVSSFKVGDRVLISCVSSCGKCTNCKKEMYSHCLNGGGWILGCKIDGTQAEYVRIPFADNSLYPIPEGGPRRGPRDVEQYFADRFRMRRPQRTDQARRHGSDRRCRPDRAGDAVNRSVLFARRDNNGGC